MFERRAWATFALLAALGVGCGVDTNTNGATAPDAAMPKGFPGATDATSTPTPSPTASTPTVGQLAAGSSCTTSVVRPLSAQLVAELDCILPNAIVEIPADNQIDVTGIFDFLQKPPADTLPTVVTARPGVTMKINSALRSLPQQYLLYTWYQAGKCNIQLAATPGTSNHEGGTAVDLPDYTGWKASMTSNGWTWFGANDVVHFDYTAGGTDNLSGKDVLAFQKLWNLNNPQDPISEDGLYGPQTGARVAKSPSGGFAIPDECGTNPAAFAPLVDDTPPDVCAM